MSQQTGQQASKRAEAVTEPWTFYINLATTAAFPGAAKNIFRGATLTLHQSAPGMYSGTMQFNYPVIQPGQALQPGQVAWSEQTYPLNVDYNKQLLVFDVSSAVQAFQDNFDANTGALLPVGTNGPPIAPPYQFKFQGIWDGSSQSIVNGAAFVPNGWLADCLGTMTGVQPSESSGSPDDSDSGGDDDPPPNATWGSG